jgi:hypothetical protein
VLVSTMMVPSNGAHRKQHACSCMIQAACLQLHTCKAPQHNLRHPELTQEGPRCQTKLQPQPFYQSGVEWGRLA